MTTPDIHRGKHLMNATKGEIMGRKFKSLSRPFNPAKARAARRGFSLVELAVVISIMSLLLGMIAVLLQGMLQTQRAGIRQVAVGQSLMRLSAQFREDVHAADSTETEGESTIRLVSQGGRTVTYRVDEDQLLRESQVADSQVNAQREAFRLPPHAKISFSVLPLSDNAKLVALTMDAQRTEQTPVPTWRPTRIEALLKRDQE